MNRTEFLPKNGQEFDIFILNKNGILINFVFSYIQQNIYSCEIYLWSKRKIKMISSKYFVLEKSSNL